jgi:multidrug resistance efflux pump
MVRHSVVPVSSLQRCLHCQSWIDPQHRREISHSSNWGCSYGTAYWASAQLRIIIKLIGPWALMRLFAGALLLIVFAAIAGFLDCEKMRHVYITVPVERGTVRTVIKATGVVNPVLMIEVGSQLSGRISEVLVNFNDVVKAGQVIARVDPEAYIAAVKKARAALKIAKATAELQRAALQRARVAVENARIASKAGEAHLAAAQAKQDEAERDVQRNTALSRTSAISNREFTASRAARDAGAAGVAFLASAAKDEGRGDRNRRSRSIDVRSQMSRALRLSSSRIKLFLSRPKLICNTRKSGRPSMAS